MYGYNIVKDELGIQHFVTIPEEAAVIKSIFEWFAAGEGTHRIARRLEQQGITTKRYKHGWSNTVILRILRNEKYVGDLAQGKTYTPNALTHEKKYNRGDYFSYYTKDHHPESAIVDRELWDKVQTILAEKAPSEEIKAKHSNRYWTSGKVYCGLCGQRYVSYQKKQKNVPYRAWVCFENHQRGTYKQITLDTGETVTVGCNARRVNDRVLKTAVHDIVADYLIPKKDAILAELKRDIEELSKPKDSTARIAELEKAVAKKQEELATLTKKLISGIIPENAYQATIGGVNAEYEEFCKKLKEAQNSTSNEAEIRIYEDYIKQLQDMVDLSAGDLNDVYYERATKQIFVYPDNLLEFRLSFIPMPIYLQYKATGRGEDYTAEFTILSAEEFGEKVAECSKNELLTEDITE